MSISYNKLWKVLIDKNMTKSELRIEASISTTTLAKLSKNLPINLDTMGRICQVLNCDISEVMVFLPEEKGNE